MDVSEVADGIRAAYEECVRQLMAAGMGRAAAEVVAENIIRDSVREIAGTDEDE